MTSNDSIGGTFEPESVLVGRPVDLLVYVHAAPKNFKKRQSIRQTWGNAQLMKRQVISCTFLFKEHALFVYSYSTQMKYHMLRQNKKENCAILIPKGYSYCCRKSNAKDLDLKSHPKD